MMVSDVSTANMLLQILIVHVNQLYIPPMLIQSNGIKAGWPDRFKDWICSKYTIP